MREPALSPKPVPRWLDLLVQIPQFLLERSDSPLETLNLGLVRLEFRLERGDQTFEDADVGFQAIDAWVGHGLRTPWFASLANYNAKGPRRRSLGEPLRLTLHRDLPFSMVV